MAERAMCETHQKLRNLNHLTASVGPQGDTHYTCNPQDRCKGSRFHSYDGAEQQQQRPFNPYPQNPNQPTFQPGAYLWDANALAAMAMQHQADGSNGPRRGMVGMGGMGGRGGGVVGGYGLAPAQFGNLAGGVPPHQEKLRCQEHNKMRSANAMDWNDRLKGYVCKPAMRCKSGKGHTEAMVTSETALCAVHNKRRRREFLDSRPDGSFQCREGQTCQAKTIEQQGNVAQQLIGHQAHQ